MPGHRPTKAEEDERSIQAWVNIILSPKTQDESDKVFDNAMDAQHRIDFRKLSLEELRARYASVASYNDKGDAHWLGLLKEVITEKEGEK